ncbi:Mu transposase C-terminal domain-containing protein [Clostridium magnum]|uniref:Transposon Tn7 transposition protein TnsB n=1 Tax=Clostridium magnum DSM 2767 TaxID=1121326 RepID=A0A162TZ84_9CLOT|nr:Mu transposase C-terminal domain-containing protein [Clostridium magnum]KZL93247.1 transposon Tn7 transposition protein TnsB [Clostridium magnum DSM 2767]SHI19260.1 Mu transposase, C-terminal [Clostridium magnum DSM 2767]
MQFFKVNDVYELTETKVKERILWVDAEYTQCYTIELNIERLNLHLRDIKELDDKFDSRKLIFSIEDDIVKYLNSIDMSECQKDLLEKSWQVIKRIALTYNEPDIFNEKTRSELIKKVINELHICKASVYKYLRQYWQGGKIKIALASELYKCGGKGKEKNLGTQKVGRKNYLSYVEPDKVGRNVSSEWKDIFKAYIKKYYFNHKETSLQKVYKIMLAEEFGKKCINDNGELIFKTIPAHECPTFSQFRYWYYKRRNIEKEIIGRKGEKEYKLNNSPLLSNAKYHAFGPGYIYEIDSTPYPVYLLNRIKSENIGRPIVYHVSDVFTTEIVGVYIGTGNACYEGAVSALYNCTENKVEFCEKYGIKIGYNDWPTGGLPNSLRADRGELAGKLPEKIVSNLGISIETTASFMGKSKGTVEGSFNIIQSTLKPYLNGVIERDFRKRGGSDARKHAAMTIYEFTRHVINAVILHNKSIIGNYPLTQEMINDGVRSIPNEIWNWGIKNISGNLRTVSDTYLKLNLLRDGVAKVTEKGIEFVGRIFRCDIGTVENWYPKARNSGYWNVNIRYDSRNLNIIYVIDSKGNRFITCYLSAEENLYRDKTYEEITAYLNDMKVELQSLRDYQNQCYLDFHQNEKDNVQNANDLNLSNKDVLTRNIKENRKIENEVYGKEQAITLGERKEEIIENPTKDQQNTNLKINIFNKIKSIRKERNNAG